MANPDPIGTILAGNNMKIIYQRYAGAIMTRLANNFFKNLFALARPMNLDRMGAKNLQFTVQTKTGSNAGYPDSTTGDISYLQQSRLTLLRFAQSPSFHFGYSQIPYEVYKLFQNGGTEGNWINEAQEAIKACGWQMNDQQASQFCQDGYGKVVDLEADGSAIAAAATGTINVSGIQFVQPNWILSPYNSGGTIYSDVKLVVTDVPPGFGAGNITVRNDGGTSYTPLASDDLRIYNSAAAEYNPGLGSITNDEAFPRAVGQNEALDNNKFKGYIYACDSDAPRSLTYEDFIQVENYMSARQNEAMWAAVQTEMGYTTLPGMYLMNRGDFNALRQSIRKGNQLFYDFPTSIDAGWGKIYTIDGTAVHPDHMIPDGTNYRVHMPSLIYGTTTPEFLFTPGGPNTPFAPIPGTTNTELGMSQLRLITCDNRLPMAQINGFVPYSVSA